MLLTADLFRDLLGTIGLMALLSVAYGMVMRASAARPWVGQIALGALFGIASDLAILDRLAAAGELPSDLRGLPVALAGAFLGPVGTAVAMALALALGGLGGPGALAGAVGLIVAGATGLGWGRWADRSRRRGFRPMLALAAASTAHLLAAALPAALLAPEAAWAAIAGGWPLLLPLHLAGVLVVGLLLEREGALFVKERTLVRAAERDPLTGLLNRRGFDRAVAEAARAGGGGAVLMLDLDHFKRINDTHGHAAGDAILRALSPRLAGALRGRDLIARLGGEEIGVFLPAIPRAEAEATARRLCAAIRDVPFALPCGGELGVTTSIGGAWAGGPIRLDDLIERADRALYAAKAAGRNRFRFAARDARPLGASLGVRAEAMAPFVLAFDRACPPAPAEAA